MLQRQATLGDLDEQPLPETELRCDVGNATSYIAVCCIAVCLLYCSLLYCGLLYCSLLYCSLLYCSLPYWNLLYCILLCCNLLYCSLMYCSLLYCLDGLVQLQPIRASFSPSRAHRLHLRPNKTCLPLLYLVIFELFFYLPKKNVCPSCTLSSLS